MMKDFEHYVDLSRMESEEQERQRAEARDRRRAAKDGRGMYLVNLILLIVCIGLAIAVLVLTLTEPVESAEIQPEAEAVVVVEDQQESEHIEDALMARAHLLGETTVTHYCICPKCCGKAPSDPGYGITASGRKATPGVSVAVDRSLIPLGSTVMVDYGDGELVYYRADDTGSAIKDNHIDVCMADHQSAINAGVKHATVWWCEEGDE